MTAILNTTMIKMIIMIIKNEMLLYKIHCINWNKTSLIIQNWTDSVKEISKTKIKFQLFEKHSIIRN